MTAEIDTESMPPEEAREIHQMLETADFFELPGEIITSSPGADRFQYQLTVADEGRTHVVSLNDSAVPQTLQPLLNRLTKIARSGRVAEK